MYILSKVLDSPSICIVTDNIFPDLKGGGEERFLNDFTNYLARKNISVTVISPARVTTTKKTSDVGINPFRLPFVGLTPFLLFFSVAAAVKIILLHKQRNFFLIHSMSTGYGGLAGLFASKILRLPFFAHSHCKRAHDLKLAILLRNSNARHVVSLYEGFESSIDLLVSKNADLVIAVSAEIRNYLTSLGVPSNRVTVNPVGLDADSFESKEKDREEGRQEFGILPNAFVIGYIGTLSTVKGVPVLIKAFSLFQNRADLNLHLLLVGAGEQKKEMENMVGSMMLRNVTFAGFRKDVSKLLATMDVFVLPSFSEGCPYSLLEALAAGKAIIANDIPGIRALVQNEQDGILVRPNDHKMIVRAILRLYYDPHLREKLCENAKRKAKQYDMNVSFNRIVSFYDHYKRRN